MTTIGRKPHGWRCSWSVLRLVSPALAAISLGGCESAATRCTRVQSEAWLAEQYTQDEREFKSRLGAALPDNYTVDDTRRLMKVIRAQMAEERRAYLDSATRAFLELPEPDPAADSAAPEVRPPPRPSDLAWYEEHCYQGKPR